MDDESNLGQSGNSDELHRLNRLRAQFTKEQDARYQGYVGVRETNEERVTDRFRVFVAHTVLKDLGGTSESRDVKEFARREANNALDGFGDSAFRAPLPNEPAKRAQPDKAQPTREAVEPIPKIPSLTPSGRDYTELRRTHEQVAAQQRPQGEEGPLSRNQLETMQQRYEAVRSGDNSTQTAAGKGELVKLAQEHAGARQNLVELHANEVKSSAATSHHAGELGLMDHQHLAEQVGTEARQIANHLQDRNPSMAQAYSKESRHAFETGRQVHAERQKLRGTVERDAEVLPAHVREDRDKTSAEQEAAKGGRELTADQKSNMHANAALAIEAKTKDAGSSGKSALTKDEQNLLRVMANQKNKGAERQR